MQGPTQRTVTLPACTRCGVDTGQEGITAPKTSVGTTSRVKAQGERKRSCATGPGGGRGLQHPWLAALRGRGARRGSELPLSSCRAGSLQSGTGGKPSLSERLGDDQNVDLLSGCISILREKVTEKK